MSLLPADEASVLSRDQVREVDRLAIEDLGIPGVVLMENAGLNVTAAILGLLAHGRGNLDDPREGRVAIFCGGGNNAGDGYVIARHLHNRGVWVRIFAASDPEKLEGDAAVNAAICRNMGLDIVPVAGAEAIRDDPEMASWLKGSHVLVDALLGTGFRGSVREPMTSLIELINARKGPQVVAVDVPSGLDCQSGEPTNATIEADVTVTFVAAKQGFLEEGAQHYLGTVLVGDIGTPPELLDRVRE